MRPKKIDFPVEGGFHGIRGRKPTPQKILELGGRSHKKKVENVDLGELSDKEARGISFDGLPLAVKKRARKTLEMLQKRVVLNSCDAESFSRYIQHLRIAYQADEVLRVEGVITHDEMGLPRKHPALQIHRDNSLAALRFEEQFGLTPSARMRLRAVDQNTEDRENAEFNDFLKDD